MNEIDKLKSSKTLLYVNTRIKIVNQLLASTQYFCFCKKFKLRSKTHRNTCPHFQNHVNQLILLTLSKPQTQE